MIRNVAHQRAGPVDLFQQDDPNELVRKRHRREREELVRTLSHRFIEADITAAIAHGATVELDPAARALRMLG